MYEVKVIKFVYGVSLGFEREIEYKERPMTGRTGGVGVEGR